jgi:V8-like Glu-specific endopeptidase
MLNTPAIVPSIDGPRIRRFNGRAVNPLYVFRGDRQVYQDTSYPWGCVGKIVNNEGRAGSGALVWPNVVVTAGHVVPWSSVYARNWWMLFIPDYFDGSSLFGAGVQSYVSDVNGYDSQGNVAGYDCAVLKLYTPLGDQTGYFGFNGYSSDWEGGNYWDVLGYPGDVAGGMRPSWEGSVDIHDDDEDATGGQELESNFCDITPGDSGGPIFGWWPDSPRVIGVVSGEEEEYQFPFSTDDNNIFASGSAFTNLIAWARSNW